MLEPAVTLTDFALFLLNAWLASRISHTGAWRSRSQYWVFLFSMIAAGALAGAVSHGWFPEETEVGHVLWRITMLLIGLAGVGCFLVATQLSFGDRLRSFFLLLASAAWLGYAYVILTIRSDFKVALMFYVPSAVLLLLAFVGVCFKLGRVGGLGMAGMLLTFAAAYVQSAGIAIHPRFFDHNATYHLIQAAGLVLVYLAGRGWLESVGEDSEDING